MTQSAIMRAAGGRNRNAASVFDRLRDDIIGLALQPGSVLSRVELQQRFGLSSTPIRDALMRLQEEGLVDIFPQHATVVSRIDLAKAREAQFLRRSIELELMQALSKKNDPGLVARLRSLIRQKKAFASAGEFQAFTIADQDFHFALYESAGVADLWHLVRKRSGHIDRLRRLNLPVAGKMREIIRAHGRIADALEKNDGLEAQEAMRDHLSRSLEFVNKLRESHPDYFHE